MPEIIKLGSLYLDDRPVDVGTLSQWECLTISDTDPNRPISWVDLGGKLVANRCVCSNISWKWLDKMGLIRGRVVEIDGNSYICRSLRLGAKDGVPNEWDSILDKTSEEESLWHYRSMYFWGQEGTKEEKVVCGWKSAKFRKSFKSYTKTPGMGFRPVLEPATADLSHDLIGYNLTFHMQGGGHINGRLCEFTDYDIVLSGDIPEWKVKNSKWAIAENGKVTIDRSSVICVQK